jgi:glycosyltransferase involved in cell wall biosynthesis
MRREHRAGPAHDGSVGAIVLIVEHPNVLAIVPAIIPSVVIAVDEPLKYLEKAAILSYTLRLEWETKLSDIEGCDIVFFYRNVDPAALCLFKFAKAIGKRLVYGLDDDFFRIRPDTDVGRYYRRRLIQGILRNLLKASDIVVVHSRSLARDVTNLNPNVAIWEDLHFDFSILEDPMLRRDAHGEKIRIGYGGNRTHGPDFYPVVPAIKRIIEEYGSKVSFDFIGFEPEELRRCSQVTFMRWMDDYAEFIKLMHGRGWDIGLAPLADTPSNRGKTNNKCREYGACLIPGIYSDLPLYRAFVKHGDTGILVPHTEDGWYNGMKTLIESRELRERIAANAYKFAKCTYQLSRTADFYQSLFLDLPTKPKRAHARWATLVYYVERAVVLGYSYLSTFCRLVRNDRETVQAFLQRIGEAGGDRHPAWRRLSSPEPADVEE